ncbi:MAG: PEP-CTERM sorting domain-containing protein [Akkermansiaceae bacterium]|nr:PEP-CTERM sorting domain-containing protein [Akkermansiaceae bacterium]
MYGNPLGGIAALEYRYTPTMNLGDIISMDAELNRPFIGYYYGKEILLWDGTNAGTITSRIDESQQGNVLTTTTYTVTQADLDAGLNHVIFRYSHDGNWGETNSVTFDITPVPEPGTVALLGLVGMTSLVRRRR